MVIARLPEGAVGAHFACRYVLGPRDEAYLGNHAHFAGFFYDWRDHGGPKPVRYRGGSLIQITSQLSAANPQELS